VFFFRVTFTSGIPGYVVYGPAASRLRGSCAEVSPFWSPPQPTNL
jgi:hypothetical protein